MVLYAFKSELFQIQPIEGTEQPGILALNLLDLAKHLKRVSSKQMFQRSQIPLAQVKAGNTFEHLLNEIRQIKYFLLVL